jgi:hypothetical protein
MTAVSVAALVAALLFALFHLPIRVLSTGKTAKLIGVAYHLLLLPVVAALPAPLWAKAAGLAWMLFDIALDGGAVAGLSDEVSGPIRQGVHIIASVWVVMAGLTTGGWLAVAGLLLAAAFIARFLTEGFGVRTGRWLRDVNALLNVVWFVSVAVVLA